jgi:hypothetical protein
VLISANGKITEAANDESFFRFDNGQKIWHVVADAMISLGGELMLA